MRSIPYSDSSLIVHCFTPNHGRISLIARGARRAKSPFRGGLMPLHQLHIRWKEPRTGGICTLLEVQRLQPLLDDSKMLAGQRLLSQANTLFPDGVEHGYKELLQAISILSRQEEMPGLPTAIWSMLSSAGVVGNLTHCWHCASEVSLDTSMYWLDAHALCALCSGHRGIELSPGCRKSILYLLEGKHVILSQNDLHTWQHIMNESIKLHR